MRSTPYELQLESHAERGPEVFTFHSADGVVSKGEFRVAELLLLNVVDPAPDEDVLVVDGNYGVLPTVLGALAGSVTVAETSARAAALCERNARENGADVDVALVADVADLDGEFDRAVYAPRPYDPTEVVRQRAVDALEALAPGGELFLAAAKTEGARRYRDTLAEVADADRIEKSQGVRAYRVPRPPGFEAPEFVTDRTIQGEIAGHEFEFVTRPGLFSPASVDRGTALLADTVRRETDLEAGDRLLDVACGYGPLGIALAAETGAVPTFSDDSRVATRCAERSLERSPVDPEAVVTADCLDGVEGPFRTVVSNPPTHAGDGVTSELFAGAHAALDPGGSLWLVYNETLRYEDDLPRRFGSVDVVRREEGYAITRARR